MTHRRTAFGLMAMVLIVASAPSVAANHSLPNPRIFWDINNNGVPGSDDSFRTYQRVGTNWTQEKITRTLTAASDWLNTSDWNPSIGTSSGLVATTRVDGFNPCRSWQAGEVAINCLTVQNRVTYFRIMTSHVSINLAKTWYYGNGVQPAGSYDYWGVMTHELGHGANLRDLYGADCGGPGPDTVHSMCGSTTEAASRFLRTTTSDDRSGANAIYAP